MTHACTPIRASTAGLQVKTTKRGEMSADTYQLLACGLPQVADYRALVASAWFKSIEEYSDAFLRRNVAALREYQEKWVKDPLHQWSRQWEYPFVIGRAMSGLRSHSGTHPHRAILDAGAGVTFLPYYLAEQFTDVEVTCLDHEPAWAAVYEQANRTAVRPIRFVADDLRHLPFSDASFDIVYCVSVLEHTNAYGDIVREFRRVLRPGGTVIITFDISIDGDSDIPPQKAQHLLGTLFRQFPESPPAEYADLSASVTASGVLTTRAVVAFDARLLPWTPPQPSLVRRLLGLGIRPDSVRNLTVFCHAFSG